MKDFTIEVTVENDGSTHSVQEGCTLGRILKAVNIPDKDRFIAAYVDNCQAVMSKRLFSSCHIRFIDKDSAEGSRIYTGSAQFILEKAIFDVTGKRDFRVLCTVGRGIYMEIGCSVDETLLGKIRERFEEIVESDIPILERQMEYDQALETIRSFGYADKEALLSTRPLFYVTFNELDGFLGTMMNVTAPSTGYLKGFEMYASDKGIMLFPPGTEDGLKHFTDNKKFYHVLQEYKEWSSLLEIANVGDLNKHCMNGNGRYLIMEGESLHEKRFSLTADRINSRGSRVVLAAGPSSSGKTTFSMRLAIQLAILGYRPMAISMDDYFIERDKTPLGKDGKPDYECPEAVDIALFNNDIKRLLAGESVSLPKYDFITGTRKYEGKPVSIGNDGILVIEGIHALNPAVLPDIDRNSVYRIYASAMMPISIDSENLIHITDNRLIRRIVRDYRTRGRSAHDTLRTWSKVRAGEDKYIFPYQENADEIVNTVLFYELSILAPIAAPLLRTVPRTAPEYAAAERLLGFLTCFAELPSDTVPPTSILREFIGGSAFTY